MKKFLILINVKNKMVDFFYTHNIFYPFVAALEGVPISLETEISLFVCQTKGTFYKEKHQRKPDKEPISVQIENFTFEEDFT